MTQTPTRDAPPESKGRQPDLPRLGLGGGLRFLWTQLSSMRTALVLLFGQAVLGLVVGVVWWAATRHPTRSMSWNGPIGSPRGAKAFSTSATWVPS